MADIFDVVADPTRRDLMRLLLEQLTAQFDEPNGGELSVGQLVGELALSQPTVSKHLKVLRDAGLVTVREQGQHRFYRLSFLPLEAIEDWLLPFVRAELAEEDRAAARERGGDPDSVPADEAPDEPADRLGQGVGDVLEHSGAAVSSGHASATATAEAVAVQADGVAAPLRSRRLPPAHRAAAESLGGAAAAGIHRLRTAQRRLRRS
jgi:ArsR family transcriptional regulator